MQSIIGHSKQKKYFEKAVKNGDLEHAYIFAGPDAIGKKKFALEIYVQANKSIFGLDPDLKIVLSDGSSIGIDEAREIKNFFSLSAHAGPYRFLIIDDAHMLTVEASNALLKIIEELPKSAVIILVSSKPALLLDTVKSRCHTVNFHSQSPEEIETYLSSRKLSQNDKDFILKISGKRIGKAISIIEKNIIEEIKKSILEFKKVLGMGDFEKIQYAKKLSDAGNYGDIIEDCINYFSADSQNNRKILKGLLGLHRILSQPQYNHKLAIENFLINIQ